jgi:hypothetical protein
LEREWKKPPENVERDVLSRDEKPFLKPGWYSSEMAEEEVLSS